MSNAHAWRHRSGRGRPCPLGCIYCKLQPKDGQGGKNYNNKTGHRRNIYKSKKSQRRG